MIPCHGFFPGTGDRAVRGYRSFRAESLFREDMRTPSGRVLLHFPEGRWEVILEILMGPSDPAFFVDLGILLLPLPGAEPYCPGHVYISRIQKTFVHIGIYGLFTACDLIAVVDQDVVNGLAVPYKGADHPVHCGKLLLCGISKKKSFHKPSGCGLLLKSWCSPCRHCLYLPSLRCILR